VRSDLDFSGILRGGGTVRKTNLEQDNLDILNYYAKIFVKLPVLKKIFITFEGFQNK
jgi:hypothetical protein